MFGKGIIQISICLVFAIIFGALGCAASTIFCPIGTVVGALLGIIIGYFIGKQILK